MTDGRQGTVVVDTNILFSAILVPRGRLLEILWGSSARFYICESVLVELFRRKEKLVQASRLTAEEVVLAYGQVLTRVELFKEGLIPAPAWDRALSFVPVLMKRIRLTWRSRSRLTASSGRETSACAKA